MPLQVFSQGPVYFDVEVMIVLGFLLLIVSVAVLCYKTAFYNLFVTSNFVFFTNMGDDTLSLISWSSFGCRYVLTTCKILKAALSFVFNGRLVCYHLAPLSIPHTFTLVSRYLNSFENSAGSMFFAAAESFHHYSCSTVFVFVFLFCVGKISLVKY